MFSPTKECKMKNFSACFGHGSVGGNRLFIVIGESNYSNWLFLILKSSFAKSIEFIFLLRGYCANQQIWVYIVVFK